MQKFRQEKQAESQQMLSRYFDMASHYTAACKVSHSRKVKKTKKKKNSQEQRQGQRLLQ